MTLDDIRSNPKEFLTPREGAPIIGCTPYTINIWAKQCPERLGFPVNIMGTRVRIPKRAFLRWIEGK